MGYVTGDVLIMTYRHVDGEEDREAVVQSITADGYVAVEFTEGGQTAFHPGHCPRQFGLIEVKKTGRKVKPTPRWYPKPGNSSYDLMC